MNMIDPNANNHSDQMNPNNDAYWQSRGYGSRPDDWDDDKSSNADSNDDNDYYDETYGDDYEFNDD